MSVVTGTANSLTLATQNGQSPTQNTIPGRALNMKLYSTALVSVDEVMSGVTTCGHWCHIRGVCRACHIVGVILEVSSEVSFSTIHLRAIVLEELRQRCDRRLGGRVLQDSPTGKSISVSFRVRVVRACVRACVRSCVRACRAMIFPGLRAPGENFWGSPPGLQALSGWRLVFEFWAEIQHESCLGPN